jgi:excisionase family DNA binding protein
MTTPAQASIPTFAREDEQSCLARIARLYDASEGRSPGSAKVVGSNGDEIELPESAQRLLEQVVRVLARGDAVSIVPVQRELTTQQAADLLNISRQYLIRLLDRGEIPFHRVGSHRRLGFDDVMKYKRRRDLERRRGLDELTRLSQELGLYDPAE